MPFSRGKESFDRLLHKMRQTHGQGGEALRWFSAVCEVGFGMLLPAVLLMAGIFFLFYLDAFFLRHPWLAFRKMLEREKGAKHTPLYELSLSLAGTLGVGNIVGVAVALSIGGAGALFWMWISALFSMILKYAEIVLGLRYRKTEKGEFLGGPMLYMKNGIGGKAGKALAAVFSAVGLFSAFFMGNTVQTNAAAVAMESAFHVPPVLCGAIFAALCGGILLSGARGVTRVTAVIIPLMSALYLFLSLRIVFMEWEKLPWVFGLILDGAFCSESAFGGSLGFLFSEGLRQGVAKGAFTHEAGAGTAPMAHGGAETKCPAKQGLFGIFEVFFDTIVLCTLTGLVILIACGEEMITDNGMLLVIYAFSRYYGKKAAYLISISIAVFAFATVVCWGYYGKRCLAEFTTSGRAETIYLVSYCAMAVVAAVMQESAVWAASDVTVSLMTVLNLTAVLWLRREVREETRLLFPQKKRRL